MSLILKENGHQVLLLGRIGFYAKNQPKEATAYFLLATDHAHYRTDAISHTPFGLANQLAATILATSQSELADVFLTWSSYYVQGADIH